MLSCAGGAAGGGYAQVIPMEEVRQLETANPCGVGRAKCLQQCLVFGDSLSGELAWSLPSSCDCSEMCGPGLESHCTIPICVYNIPAVNHMALNVKELFSYSE